MNRMSLRRSVKRIDANKDSKLKGARCRPWRNRSTIVRAKSAGLGLPNGDAAYDRGSNAARSIADEGGQESLPLHRAKRSKRKTKARSNLSHTEVWTIHWLNVEDVLPPNIAGDRPAGRSGRRINLAPLVVGEIERTDGGKANQHQNSTYYDIDNQALTSFSEEDSLGASQPTEAVPIPSSCPSFQ